MKVTEPIDVYIADKLFQLTSADVPEQLSDEQYRARLSGKTLVVFGGWSRRPSLPRTWRRCRTTWPWTRRSPRPTR